MPLSADRIYLKEGGIIRGKVLSIGVNDYKIKDSNGKIKKVAKNSIISVKFSKGKEESGYFLWVGAHEFRAEMTLTFLGII